MGGVAAELPDLPKGGLEARDHIVEGAGKPADFVGRFRHGQPLGEIAGRDPLSGQRNSIDGTKGPSRKKPPSGQRDGQREGMVTNRTSRRRFSVSSTDSMDVPTCTI